MIALSRCQVHVGSAQHPKQMALTIYRMKHSALIYHRAFCTVSPLWKNEIVIPPSGGAARRNAHDDRPITLTCCFAIFWGKTVLNTPLLILVFNLAQDHDTLAQAILIILAQSHKLQSPPSGTCHKSAGQHMCMISLCTLHFSLCTLHFALCTLHFALCTLHFALCTLHFALCTLHFALCPFESRRRRSFQDKGQRWVLRAN